MAAGVSLSAKNATVGQILAEWARVGQTKIVNAERVSGGPMTLELTNVPEAEAIEILLRSAGGFLLAPRQVETANASRFDRILILPPSVPVTVFRASRSRRHHRRRNRARLPSHNPDSCPAAGAPPRTTTTTPLSDRTSRQLARKPPRAPVFNTFPQALPQRTDAAAAPAPNFIRHRASGCGGAWHGPSDAAAGEPARHDRAAAATTAVVCAASVLMSLAEDVGAAITDAMRRKDAARLSALRMLKAAFMNREVEKGRALDDNEARQVVQSLVKQRRDSIEQFSKGGRQDLVDKETAEVAVLESYLPPAVDPALIERAVADAISETGATSAKDMGRVMKAVMARLAGQTVDGKSVNELVRKKLSGA
jgi:uncharacterized protein YqeY